MGKGGEGGWSGPPLASIAGSECPSLGKEEGGGQQEVSGRSSESKKTSRLQMGAVLKEA